MPAAAATRTGTARRPRRREKLARLRERRPNSLARFHRQTMTMYNTVPAAEDTRLQESAPKSSLKLKKIVVVVGNRAVIN